MRGVVECSIKLKRKAIDGKEKVLTCKVITKARGNIIGQL